VREWRMESGFEKGDKGEIWKSQENWKKRMESGWYSGYWRVPNCGQHSKVYRVNSAVLTDYLGDYFITTGVSSCYVRNCYWWVVRHILRECYDRTPDSSKASAISIWVFILAGSQDSPNFLFSLNSIQLFIVHCNR
jgi:hypothetical protein